MIRFIDIRNQGTGERFAFYNTVYDQFMCFSLEQTWTNWAEFEEAFKSDDCTVYPIERFKGLCPEWVFNDEEDDIEGFYR